MRISFAFGFILLIAGAAGIAGYLGMGKTETICVVGLVVLMRIAISIEELIVEARYSNTNRLVDTFLNKMQKEMQSGK